MNMIAALRLLGSRLDALPPDTHGRIVPRDLGLRIALQRVVGANRLSAERIAGWRELELSRHDGLLAELVDQMLAEMDRREKDGRPESASAPSAR